jgi:hypothetical protein
LTRDEAVPLRKRTACIPHALLQAAKTVPAERICRHIQLKT